MSWFLIILFLNLTFNGFSKARLEKKLPSAVVVGTVLCDTCFQDDFSKTSHYISGATVAVECRDGSSKPSFREQVKTNKEGKFKVVLPFSVSKHVKKIEGCSVKLIRSSEPYCTVASTATSSSLHLKSRKKGIHIFSAGFFTFKPLKQPNLCSQKPSIPSTNKVDSMKTFLPPFNNPVLPSPTQTPLVPNIPNLPPVYPSLPPLPKLPELPPLPPLPPLPVLPPLPGLPQLPPSSPIGKAKDLKHIESSKKTQQEDQKQTNPQFLFPPILPPNPLQPPSVLPPNPLQPPPLIPNPFQPPPLIPNPFQPPPLIPNPLQPPPLIPNPFQPPPLIPNPFQPPPAPLFPLPPIPFLTPPPPPPSLFPPFPFPPLPRIPGFPPGPPREKASPSSNQSP